MKVDMERLFKLLNERKDTGEPLAFPLESVGKWLKEADLEGLKKELIRIDSITVSLVRNKYYCYNKELFNEYNLKG